MKASKMSFWIMVCVVVVAHIGICLTLSEKLNQSSIDKRTRDLSKLLLRKSAHANNSAINLSLKDNSLRSEWRRNELNINKDLYPRQTLSYAPVYITLTISLLITTALLMHVFYIQYTTRNDCVETDSSFIASTQPFDIPLRVRGELGFTLEYRNPQFQYQKLN